MLNNSSVLSAGRSVQHFRIERVLACNCIHHLYLASDGRRDRHVAIRELFPVTLVSRDRDGCTVVPNDGEAEAFAAMRRDFFEDATSEARWHHPAFLSPYDVFEQNGTAYVVTAHLSGEDFDQHLRRNEPLCEKELRAFVQPILEVLEMMHMDGFLHLDVTPTNIRLESLGDQCRPVLTGSASTRFFPPRKIDPPYICVTRGYSPFEQYLTNGLKGPWTDVYSLGAVLFRAITGKPPEDSTDRLEADNVPLLADNPPPGYSREFLATVDKALRMPPRERWLTCRHWLDALTPRPSISTVRRPWYHRLLAA